MHRYGYNPLSVGDRLDDDKLKSLGDLDGQDIRACGWLGSTSQFFSTPSANTSFKNGLYSANDVSSIK